MAAPALSAEPGAPKTQVAIGVVSFQQLAPPGTEMPDVATLLAKRLAALGAARIVGPSKLGVPAGARPEPASVRVWAADAGVDGVITGRVTRIGRKTSLDVRMRSGRTGRAVATYVEEANDPDGIEGAVGRLAARIAADAGSLAPSKRVGSGTAAPPPAPPARRPSARHAAPDPRPAKTSAASEAEEVAALEHPAAPPAVASAPPPASESASPTKASAGRKSPANLGTPILPVQANAPVSIHADELEAFQDHGERRLVFTHHVRVAQKDVTLTADHLEAYYPPGSNQPEHLVAEGHVVVAQPQRRMLCDKAVYQRAEQRVLCQGSAELQQGNDRVQGKEIEIFLASGRVRVTGGAVVDVRPDQKSDAKAGSK